MPRAASPSTGTTLAATSTSSTTRSTTCWSWPRPPPRPTSATSSTPGTCRSPRGCRRACTSSKSSKRRSNCGPSSDPPKETCAAALEALKASGVEVKILTGDNDIVTRKICHEVGLAVDRIVLGSEIATLSPDELASLAETAAVFAKVSPSQKAAIIDALHRKGHVVGYLGDGINDGPALKAADVGISVDSAVDIAKDSADIILLEKSLAVLGDGVIEGRKVFGNITKYIKMGASSNFGNMFSVLGASVFLPFLPMTAIQVLTNNLLYDFSQTTIPTDNVDAEYLAVPRRWDIGNIAKFVLFIGPISSIFDYVTYFLMLYGFNAWNNPALFQTGWFVESLLTQTLIIHIIRTAKIPFLESRASTRAHHDDHHHCRNRDSACPSPGWAAFWVSSRYLMLIGSRSALSS